MELLTMRGNSLLLSAISSGAATLVPRTAFNMSKHSSSGLSCCASGNSCTTSRALLCLAAPATPTARALGFPRALPFPFFLPFAEVTSWSSPVPKNASSTLVVCISTSPCPISPGAAFPRKAGGTRRFDGPLPPAVGVGAPLRLWLLLEVAREFGCLSSNCTKRSGTLCSGSPSSYTRSTVSSRLTRVILPTYHVRPPLSAFHLPLIRASTWILAATASSSSFCTRLFPICAAEAGAPFKALAVSSCCAAVK
mmetsp:Transcript_15300/g.24394  ORF Transcript_15300/g.24394 Transcript_15300/m.24394 type:complete len:252 (-) Transcript_15300:2421-3176(-)